MKNHKDYQERLPEHPEPLELTAHEEEAIAAAPLADKTEPVAATAAVSGGHGYGSLGWAGLAALVIAVLIGSIYFFSYRAQHDPTEIGPLRADNVPTAQLKYKRPGTLKAMAATPVVKVVRVAESADALPADLVYLFPLNGSEIIDDAALDEFADKVADSGAYVAVVAYTDESGNAAYNQRLSERRAKKVGDYLVAHGVPASHVKTTGKGQTHAYHTAAQDRRAELHATLQN